MGTRLVFIVGIVFHLGIAVCVSISLKARLESIHVISDIKYRFATTLVSMKYYNPYNKAVPADLHVNMPKNSFISNFSMEIDGNVTVGEVKEKSIAKNIFNAAIQQGQSAGHVEVKRRNSNVFDISVNVVSQKYIVYNLTYQELLTRQAHKYKHTIHLSHGSIIDKFLVEVYISEPQDIINLAVSKITNDKLTNVTDDGELDFASNEYISSKEVYIKYNPNRKQQEEISEYGPVGLLNVEYDVDRNNNSNFIYAVDGYFVHFFSNDSLPSLKKDVIFMLDISGSMSGAKMEQLKAAMVNIINQLDPELDEFLIGIFNGKVSWIKQSFLKANEINKQLAKNYIAELKARGGTNINSALLESIKKHSQALTYRKKRIIIFLTDGKPTNGERNVDLIKRNIKYANKDISLFTLGFGEDCDSKFLRVIATENGGFNRKIYVDTDSKLQIKNLYEEISNILLKDISIKYLNRTNITSSTSFSSYFEGSELVVAGVLSNENLVTMSIALSKTDQMGNGTDFLKVPITNEELNMWEDEYKNPGFTTFQSFSEITKKTYVYLTLKELLKKSSTPQVTNRIINLALKYNFVTPLTSMVVTNSKVKEEHFEEVNRDIIPTSNHHRKLSSNHHRKLSSKHHRILSSNHHRIPTRNHHRIPTRNHHRGLSMKHHRIVSINRDIPTSNHHRILSTSTKIHPTFPTTTQFPTLPDTPAIIIKPVNCKSHLCFTHHTECNNQTKITLLTDKLAKIYIYGYLKKISGSNCLETLNRVVIKMKNKVYFEVTPDFIIAKGKKYNATKLNIIKLPLKRFVLVRVIIQKTVNDEKFISLYFQLLSKFIQPEGILGDYFMNFNCIKHLPNELQLSNKALVFHKINYLTPTGVLDQCYKM